MGLIACYPARTRRSKGGSADHVEDRLTKSRSCRSSPGDTVHSCLRTRDHSRCTLRNSRWNLGSERSGSNSGCTLSQTIQKSRAS